jgi:hypothetical protein
MAEKQGQNQNIDLSSSELQEIKPEDLQKLIDNFKGLKQ